MGGKIFTMEYTVNLNMSSPEKFINVFKEQWSKLVFNILGEQFNYSEHVIFSIFIFYYLDYWN